MFSLLTSRSHWTRVKKPNLRWIVYRIFPKGD
jgi:hypothetical protein